VWLTFLKVFDGVVLMASSKRWETYFAMDDL